MGLPELTEALRREAGLRHRQVWAEAEREVAAAREENERRKRELRQAMHRRCRARLAVLKRELQAATCEELSKERNRQQQLLAEQGWQQALSQLPALAEHPSRAALFQSLAAEVPAADWEELRVHPDDQAVAAARFATARVTADPEIRGGLLASCDRGRVEVDNRLGTRLGRCWPELLATIMLELRHDFEVEHAAS